MIHDVLRLTDHGAFPIVNSNLGNPANLDANPSNMRSYGRLQGLVLRQDIISMVKHKIYEKGPDFDYGWELFQRDYPRKMTTEDVLNDKEIEWNIDKYFLDFKNIINPAPQTVSWSLAYDRVFAQFRSTGARHLVVVNEANEVLGMITRKDLYSPTPTRKWCKDGSIFAKTPVMASKFNKLFKHRNAVDTEV